MANCPSCEGNHYFNFECEDCRYNPITGRPPKNAPKTDDEIVLTLKRIASSLEAIERHMAFNNGTLEGLTRNYDPNIRRR